MSSSSTTSKDDADDEFQPHPGPSSAVSSLKRSKNMFTSPQVVKEYLLTAMTAQQHREDYRYLEQLLLLHFFLVQFELSQLNTTQDGWQRKSTSSIFSFTAVGSNSPGKKKTAITNPKRPSSSSWYMSSFGMNRHSVPMPLPTSASCVYSTNT